MNPYVFVIVIYIYPTVSALYFLHSLTYRFPIILNNKTIISVRSGLGDVFNMKKE